MRIKTVISGLFELIIGLLLFVVIACLFTLTPSQLSHCKFPLLCFDFELNWNRVEMINTQIEL